MSGSGNCRRGLMGLVAFGLCGVMAANGVSPSPQPASAKSPIAKPLAPDLFKGWPANRKPAVAFVVSGQQHSYLKFCGCSSPQLGGFERRYNFMAKLREQGWPLIGLDLGDLVMHQSGTPQPQTMLKYVAAMKSLATLGYSAQAIGELDLKLPLLNGLGETVLQKPEAFTPCLPRIWPIGLLTFRTRHKRMSR